MAEFSQGDRVRLVHTDDEFTPLRPGDTGTVAGIMQRPAGKYGDESIEVIHVDWDRPATLLSMIPASGDTLELIVE